MKFTKSDLRKLVMEEMAKQDKVEDHKNDAEELDDAGDYAKHLEKHIDFMKALKVEEARLQKRLKKIAEQKLTIQRKVFGK